MKKSILIGFFGLVGSFDIHAESRKILLDVRSEAEWNEKHLTNDFIDFKRPDFKEKIAKLDKSKHYQAFCRSGNRSGQAVRIMKDLGFANVENVGSLEDAQKLTGLPCKGPACGK